MNARLSSLGRWIVPVTGVGLAVGGLGLLFAGEFLDASPRSAEVSPSEVSPSEPSPSQRSGFGAQEEVALTPLPGSGPTDPRVVALPGQAPVELPEPAAAAPAVRESQEAFSAQRVLGQLVEVPGLPGRIDRLEEEVRRLPPARAAEVLCGLLDSQLPGDHYESETLRLNVLARLGSMAATQPRAEAALCERLAPGCPRPERLVALEMIARVPGAGRARLVEIAAGDPDPFVQDKARRALERTQ